MHILAVVSQKGGSGKTTLALALAVAAQRAGRTVAVIDLDPQATAATWADRRQNAPPVVVSAQAARLAPVLQTAHEQGADLVIIDTPPRVEQAALTAARAASLIVLPCRPAIFDLDTVATTLALVKTTGTRTVAVLNGVLPRGTRHVDAAGALGDLGIDVCTACLGFRTAFADASVRGLTAQEWEPEGKAAQEIESLYTVIADYEARTLGLAASLASSSTLGGQA